MELLVVIVLVVLVGPFVVDVVASVPPYSTLIDWWRDGGSAKADRGFGWFLEHVYAPVYLLCLALGVLGVLAWLVASVV